MFHPGEDDLNLNKNHNEAVAILVVEDDPMQAEALRLQLIGCGYKIAGMAKDGVTAVALAQKSSPDVVLMDIVLPGKLDGIDAAQIIRESCNVPVLYLTAFDDDEFFRRAKVTEPYAYLLKPSTPREIQLAIGIALYQHQAERAERETLQDNIRERTLELVKTEAELRSALALQQQMTVALQEQELHFKQAQSVAHIGSWHFDVTRTKLAWSEELFRLYGVSPVTFTPSIEGLIKLIHPDDRAAMQTWIKTCASGHKPAPLEFRCIWPDGTIQHIEGQGELFFDADGKLSHISGTGQDISERKKTEKLMLRHKRVIDTAMDGFWLSDSVGNLLEANEAYAAMSGYTIDELTTMHISRLEANEQPQEVAAHIKKIITQGHDRFVTRHRRKDGQEIDVEISTTYLPEIKQFFVFCRDITKQKLDEQALRIAAITFHAQEAIMIVDAYTNIIQVNRAFSEITGYSADEVVGKNPNILKSGRHDHSFYQTMWQQLILTGCWMGEVWDKRKNGEVYPKWLTVTAVKNEQQQTTHFVGIFSDITVRKQYDDAIKALAFHDELTQLPNRRLFSDRLTQAISASQRSGLYSAVIFLDLDNFKPLNDQYGHDAGDLLLIEAAQRLAKCVRAADTSARFGGDEFVVLLREIDLDGAESSKQAAAVAEKIRAALAEPYRLRVQKSGVAGTIDIEHRCTSSIGVVMFVDHDAGAEALLQKADKAMYQAKEAGRNQIRFFNPDA